MKLHVLIHRTIIFLHFIILLNQKTLAALGEPFSLLSRTPHGDIKQLVTPSFYYLPLERRIFAYYISMAIESGRDITWKQKTVEGFAIRQFLEGLYSLTEKQMNQKELSALQIYFKKLLSHHGNYNMIDNEKFVLENITFDELLQLAQKADSLVEQGIQITGLEHPSHGYVQEAQRLEKELMDSTYKIHFRPEPGQEPLTDSATNYYGAGITQKYLDENTSYMVSHDFLGRPVMKQNGEIRNQHQRIKGRFHKELSQVDKYLELATHYANSEEKKIIAAHRKALHTGSTEDVKRAESLWVQYKPTDIDFVIGFTETNEDPLDRRGSWYGFIVVLDQDPEKLARTQKIIDHFYDFEAQTPFEARFRKPVGGAVPTSQQTFMLFSGGSNGEIAWHGLNLPNWPTIHKKYGSKSFTMANVIEDIEPSLEQTQNNQSVLLKEQEVEAFYLKEYRPLFKEFDPKLVSQLKVTLHEIRGHGSSITVNPDIHALGQYYNTLEEGRAELAALYHGTSDLLRQFDILPQEWSPEKMERYSTLHVLTFFTAQIRSYQTVSEEATHLTNIYLKTRQMILKWLLSHEKKPLEIVYDKGVPKIKIHSVKDIHEAVGQLWYLVQNVKSTGDFKMAELLLNQLGQYSEPFRKMRSELLKVSKKLNISLAKPIHLNPEWYITQDSQNNITNVEIGYKNVGFNSADFIKHQIRRSQGYYFNHSCRWVLSL